MKIPDDELDATRFRQIKALRKIQADISAFRTRFCIPQKLTNYRDKIVMGNSLHDAHACLDKFIDGLIEGTFEENRQR